MADIIGLPPVNSQLPVLDEDEQPIGHAEWPAPWGNFMTKAYMILFACSESGTTANRPTTNLYPGRVYFDTSLGANGKPIWVNKGITGWVLADGTAA